MTTLILAVQKIVPRAGIKNRIARIEDIFLAINARGLLTIALGGVMVVGIAGYIVLVAHSFNLGMRLRAAGVTAAEEERAVKNLDIAAREREANIAVRFRTALEGMERVSSVIYLEAGSVAMR